MSSLVAIVCLASTFGYPGDRFAGGRTVAGPYPRHVVGVAHRTLPINSWVEVRSVVTGRIAILRVVDRGPWGKVSPDGEWVNACPRCEDRARARRWKWRGCIDLTPSAARRLGLPVPSMTPVLVTPIPPWRPPSDRVPMPGTP